jgi:hypothetical protein
MAYTCEISRTNPSCFLFLIDQSGSMVDPFGGAGSTKKKSEQVADVVNRLLQNLILKCAKAEGVRDYFHVGVLGYGNRGVASAFGGALAGKDLAAISEVAGSPLRIEQRTKTTDDGAGGTFEKSVKFPIWFDSMADGGTPMCEALGKAQSVIKTWLEEHGSCYPPTVINITDGEATDGDPGSASQSLRGLGSSDGNVLLYNIHLSGHRGSPVEFPDEETILPDEYAKLLFRMSSILPENTRSFAQQEGYQVSEMTRGFSFNADAVALIRFLDIGTRPSNLR